MVALNSDLDGNGTGTGVHNALSPTVDTEAKPPVRLDNRIERLRMVDVPMMLFFSADIEPAAGKFMLTALSRHSLIDLDIQASGDVHIDGHHVVEDTAIVLGQALGEALGDKHGIRRYADATVPLDEALAHCVVDVAGRPYVV